MPCIVGAEVGQRSGRPEISGSRGGPTHQTPTSPRYAYSGMSMWYYLTPHNTYYMGITVVSPPIPCSGITSSVHVGDITLSGRLVGRSGRPEIPRSRGGPTHQTPPQHGVVAHGDSTWYYLTPLIPTTWGIRVVSPHNTMLVRCHLVHRWMHRGIRGWIWGSGRPEIPISWWSDPPDTHNTSVCTNR